MPWARPRPLRLMETRHAQLTDSGHNDPNRDHQTDDRRMSTVLRQYTVSLIDRGHGQSQGKANAINT